MAMFVEKSQQWSDCAGTERAKSRIKHSVPEWGGIFREWEKARKELTFLRFDFNMKLYHCHNKHGRPRGNIGTL